MKTKQISYSKYFKLLIPAILLFLFSGCLKQADKEVAAYVNNEPIYASELKREIARKVKGDRAFELTPEAECDQLENIINRRLIVQAAMKKGLAQEEHFVNTIQSFWEQTLIRDFLDYKNKQAHDYIFVTDQEINKYYAGLAQRITFKVLRVKDKRQAEDARRKYLKDKDLSAWQSIGPLGYEEIESSMLLDSFTLPIGEVKEIEDSPNYYLVVVVNKEAIAVKPLGEIKAEIEKRVAILKEKRLFEEWLRESRKKADIKINKEHLK